MLTLIPMPGFFFVVVLVLSLFSMFAFANIIEGELKKPYAERIHAGWLYLYLAMTIVALIVTLFAGKISLYYVFPFRL